MEPRGRTGRTSPLAPPVNTVSVTGSGDGQTHGQYEVDTATRRRWPARNVCAIESSVTVTS